MTLRITIFETDWGWLGLTASEHGVVRLTLPQPSPEIAWEKLEGAFREDVPVFPETFYSTVSTPQPAPAGSPDPATRQWMVRLRSTQVWQSTASDFDLLIVDQLQRYFRGEAVGFDVPLDLSAHTPFLQKVWEATRAIPYGETRSYAELAAMVGRPRAYRAVGRAMALNPVPIIIPCHRVIGSDGHLHGYGGGLDLKRRLLAMERRNAVVRV